MEFEIDHVFSAGVDEVAAALLNPDYQTSLDGIGPLSKREVLDQTTTDGGRVLRRVRCVLHIDVSGVARSFIGDADPAWVEEATWDPRAKRWDWVIRPEVHADLLSSSGTIELLPQRDETLRTIRGEVKVRVPFYGGKVESWIVEGLTRSYEEEAQRLTDWLDGLQG